jgi:hypothetical protein
MKIAIIALASFAAGVATKDLIIRAIQKGLRKLSDWASGWNF